MPERISFASSFVYFAKIGRAVLVLVRPLRGFAQHVDEPPVHVGVFVDPLPSRAYRRSSTLPRVVALGQHASDRLDLGDLGFRDVARVEPAGFERGVILGRRNLDELDG